ncbi:MAG: sigma-70 family RNA polymerase sigma factor [Planctomycetota bacterium]
MADLPLTRQSLLLRLKQRSEDAWQEFLSIYERALFEYAQRRGLQEADARDVAQEVLAALDKKVLEWEPDPERGKLRGWLLRVARNLAVDKIAERAKAPIALSSLESNAMNPAAWQLQSKEFSMEYQRCLLHWAAERIRRDVHETTWQAFWLTAMEGLSAAEVGQKLGLSAGNVYAAKFRVMAKLQKIVESVGDYDETNDLPISKEST